PSRKEPESKISPRLLIKLSAQRERAKRKQELDAIEDQLVALARRNDLWYQPAALQILSKLDEVRGRDLRCFYCCKIIPGANKRPIMGDVVCSDPECQKQDDDHRDACAD